MPQSNVSMLPIMLGYGASMGVFIFPAIVSIAVSAAAFLWGGLPALFLVLLLAVLETTLSFDNAVVHAKVLARMAARWQRRFLQWGIPVAVFGTRFVLPIFIVAAAAGLAPLAVLNLAIFDPAEYGRHLDEAHVAIAAFGSAFLFMVSLKYFFNDRKTVHWIEIIERYLSRWGGIEAIEVALTLLVLLVCAFIVPIKAGTILIAGIIGVILFIVIEGVAQSFEMQAGASPALGGGGGGGAGTPPFLGLKGFGAAVSLGGGVGALAP